MARTERRRGQSAGRRRVTGAAGEQAERVAPVPRPASVAPPRAPARRGSRFGFLKRLQPHFVTEVISELRKVTWPTFAETRYLTFVVAVVALSVGVVLGLVDLGFGWLIEQLFFN